MSELQIMMTSLLSWGQQISKLYSEIEEITDITFENGKYKAIATIKGREYIVTREEGYMGTKTVTLPPDFKPGMIKEIMGLWAAANKISLDPKGKLPVSIYSERRKKA